MGGSSSVGRASAFQAEGRGFEPRLPLHFFYPLSRIVPLFLDSFRPVAGRNVLVVSNPRYWGRSLD